MLASISLAANKMISFRINGLKNPPSTKPAGNISLLSLTSAGYYIETVNIGPSVVNTLPGIISLSKAIVFPDIFITNVSATYYVSFAPYNFVQSMKMKITVPPEIFIGSSILTCTGISGTDTPSLDCTLNITDQSLTISNAFNLQTTAPENITFSISPMINPAKKI